MIRAERIQVGPEPVDLTEGSELSGVTVYVLTNASDSDALLIDGGSGDPFALRPNATLPSIVLGSTDKLYVRRPSDSRPEPIDVVLGWT